MPITITEEDILERQKFDVGEFIAAKRKKPEIEEDLSKKVITHREAGAFQEVCRAVFQYYEQQYEKGESANADAEKRIELQHQAIIGDPKAVKYMKDEILDFLRSNNLTNTPHPQYYDDLTDAIFHELYGLGPLATWQKYPKSQSAQIIGTRIYYDDGVKQLRPERFESIERVEGVVRALTMKDSRSCINDYMPELELDMYDGTRVSIMIPPRVKQHTITFRRFVVKNFSLAHQVELGTIPEEAIPVIRALAKTRPNTVIAGPVRSGKSTLMTTLKSERNPADTVVCIENHFELAWSQHFPNQPIIEIQSMGHDLHKIFPYTLRQDPTWGALGEVREREAECALLLCERGSSGLLCTYHLTSPWNIPGQWARLTMQISPNRTYQSEVIRIAENIDFIIVMEELENSNYKRVTSVVEVVLDPYSLEVSTHEIMRYDRNTDTWSYKCDLSQGLINKMRKYDSRQTDILIDTLKALESKKPITGATIVSIRV
ncbi:MAG: ATPase, T2SS/T4P/T4SS family [Clostridia bacterium]|nr:ATPase, T2SS/T4P/T4SS family [Clostridia bacterium]